MPIEGLPLEGVYCIYIVYKWKNVLNRVEYTLQNCIFIREISVITSFAFNVTNKQKCVILCCMKLYVHDNFHDDAFRTLRNDIIRPWNLYSGVCVVTYKLIYHWLHEAINHR